MNPVEPLDVNGDGVIVPLDALLIINELNANGSHPLPDPPPLDWGRYIDTNSDGSVAPIDALLVINHLNANTPASAEAEPDAAVAAATLRENTLPRVESRAVESKQVDGVFAQLAARNEHALRDAVPGWFKARGLFDDAWTGQGE